MNTRLFLIQLRVFLLSILVTALSYLAAAYCFLYFVPHPSKLVGTSFVIIIGALCGIFPTYLRSLWKKYKRGK